MLISSNRMFYIFTYVFIKEPPFSFFKLEGGMFN